ncbi:alpha/beta fold hydrolase [Vibrio splendidus]|uniref:Proline iminopeptidase n=1 Tax=Vibrio splendidus 12E03 TaxID=1191305 RepID=A0A1E5FTB7_VIBSP|nr:alpha/beta hydrolase [Vibrio splendidus]OEF93668.1 proline iminopeptidase [Vibrio splendidus 12E03]
MNDRNLLIVYRDNYQLQVERYGTGPHLLIIGSVNYYKKVIPESLHDYFTCVYVDHRGFSKCDASNPVESVSLDTITRDIQVICDSLNLTKTSVLGHSGHAYMAMHFASNTQINIEKLIVVGAAPSLSGDMQEKQFAHWSENASEQRKKLLDISMARLESDIAKQPERKFAHICRRLGPMRWKDASFDELSLWDDVEMNTPLLDTLWGEIFRDIELTQFSSSLDTTVINGELDFSIAPIEVWESIEGAFKSLQLIKLEDVSHTPMLEEPEKFVDTILSIFKR